MVRGSDDDSKSSGSKPEYDGTIKPWAAARIAIKSFLHVNGKLQVVQHGVATESNIGTALEERLSPTNGAELGELLPHQTTTPDGGSAQWKIMIQDETTMRTGRDGTQVIGPLKSADIIDMIEDGNLDTDSSLISYCPIGFDTALEFWEPFSHDKLFELYKIARSEASVKTLVLPTSETNTPTIVKGRSTNDDIDAYHLIISCITIKADTGSALIQQIDEKFEDNQSGHDLFKWLDERAKPSGDSKNDALRSADDALEDIEEFKLPGGELTKEVLNVQGAAFATLWRKQPKERWGLQSDCFNNWVKKLPDDPFNDLLSNLHSINLINPGYNVLDDFDKANKLICSLYSNWCKTHPKVVIKEKGKTGDKDYRALLARGGNPNDDNSWKICFRCWKTGDHLSYQCDKPPKTCRTCGLDSAKTRISCGGEYEPDKCMISGYEPERRAPKSYMDKLQQWAERNNVKFGKNREDGKVGASSGTAMVAHGNGSTPGGLSLDGMAYKVETDEDGNSYLVGRKGI
jgi:hypothetical protein